MEQSLDRLPLGEWAVVVQIEQSSLLGRRLREMGITEGAQICRLRQAPMGDPSAYAVRGSILAIRARDAAHILVRPAHILSGGGISIPPR
ncbi:MAG: FeoA family protein [Oscillospiraceae bacterium]|nr:FeoA family protein [Oscillospiraceae bacterium]